MSEVLLRAANEQPTHFFKERNEAEETESNWQNEANFS
jgi:hypothetical protein